LGVLGLIKTFVVLVCFFLIAATPVPSNHSNYPVTCPDGSQGVECVELKSVELTWDTPVEREDGSPLSFNEISHYVIQYGLTENSISTIAVAKSNSVTLRSLPSGVYFFRIATVDSDKTQGQFSADISQTL
jgi:hypothetical protein